VGKPYIQCRARAQNSIQQPCCAFAGEACSGDRRQASQHREVRATLAENQRDRSERQMIASANPARCTGPRFPDKEKAELQKRLEGTAAYILFDVSTDVKSRCQWLIDRQQAELWKSKRLGTDNSSASLIHSRCYDN